MYPKQRSLTFIPPSVFSMPEIGRRDSNVHIFSIGLSGNNTFGTINTTNAFNKHLNPY
jgi:hypothetical protein